MCLHLFADSEAYHEQMAPIPSSAGRLDMALSNAHLSCSYSSHRYSFFCVKNTTRHRCNECRFASISEWEHNSECASTINRGLTPLTRPQATERETGVPF